LLHIAACQTQPSYQTTERKFIQVEKLRFLHTIFTKHV
jgi:hypothetical protein